MRYLILIVLAVLLLAGCATQTTTQSWSQSASGSCSGFLCRVTINQEMPQPNANNILLAASILAIGCVLLVALVLGARYNMPANLPHSKPRMDAERRARDLGYTSLEALLETAYAAERPWTEVADEIGVCHVDTVAQWARKLGMCRGEGWNQQRAHRAHQAPQPTRHQQLVAAVQRAALRVHTPAAQRSLSRCMNQPASSADVPLYLTPAEEAEWAANRRAAYLL